MNGDVIEFTVPQNTPATSPVRQINHMIFASSGTVISVQVPPGHKGLTGIRVEASGRRLMPSSGGSSDWLRGDAQTFGPLVFRLESPPYSLELVGYNTDTTYPHTWFIHVD